MANIILILIIGGFLLEEMRIADLKNNNKRIIDIVKDERQFNKWDKASSIELARQDERLKISHENFMKTCDEYIKECERIEKSDNNIKR